MFTKNYYLARTVHDYIYYNNDIGTAQDSIYQQITNINGNKCTMPSGYGYASGGEVNLPGQFAILFRNAVMLKTSKSGLIADPSSYSSSYPSGGIYFGNGTEPESIDNCSLSGEIFTTYNTTYTRDVIADETGSTHTMMFTITNTGDVAFTISEVGIIEVVYCKYTSSRYFANHVITERTLLESPVTIEPGGIGQVTYTIRMNYPVA